ncbi:MAG: helix-turn-helix domain-containing protein [Myxococcota bacterium]
MTSHRPTRPPGRPPREEGPAVTREALLDEAARMIGDRGFEGTSVRGLAQALGVSHGTVQRHFATKRELWEALVDEVLVPNIVTNRGNPREPVAQGLAGEIARRLAPSEQPPGLTGAILTDGSPGALERLTYLGRALRPFQRANGAGLLARRSRGEIRPIDPRAVMALIGIAIATLGSSSTALQAIVGVDLANDEARAHLTAELTDLLLYGILPRAEDGPPA